MPKNQSCWRSDQEWFDLITEARQSGLSDSQWCRLNGIPHSTFHTAARRLRDKSYALPDRADTAINPLDFTSKQEVVRVDITRDCIPEKYDEPMPGSSPALTSSSYLDNSHTIEIQLGEANIKLSNNASPDLVRIITRTLMGGNYAC